METIPDVVSGECDGMGCGFNVCWCEEYAKMRNEFQRVNKIAWGSGSELEKAWDQAWRFGTTPLMDRLNKVKD